MIAVRSGNRLRVLKVGPKPNGEGGDTPGRKSGWVDLRRLRVPVIPGVEWTQMFNEVWRLQRDQFWTPDMSHIDWVGIHDRYLPLVERVSSRSEFSDLVWELQGELSTSHCYEFGGDYRPSPHYSQGQLGADFIYDEAADGWKVVHIARGDAWDEKASSPFERPLVDVVGGRYPAGDQRPSPGPRPLAERCPGRPGRHGSAADLCPARGRRTALFHGQTHRKR